MKGNPRPTRMPSPKINNRYLPKGNIHEENPQGRKLAEKLRNKSKKK